MADSSPLTLRKTLTLTQGTAIVMGSMIGSGVFIVAADIARQTQSAALLMATWILTALLTLLAALSYGELAAALPAAGGQYVYLREAFGPLIAFLYGWTLFFVIQTGTIAAVAVAFAKFTAVLLPGLATWQPAVAISVLVFLAWVNSRGVKTGALVQEVFTFAKIAALVGLIAAGLLAPNPVANIEWNVPAFSWDVIKITGVAMVGALFSSDAWNNVTFIAGEMKNPRRDVPLALGLGVAAVSVLYLASNYVYLRLLPLAAIQGAPADRVGTAAAAIAFGDAGTWMMAIAIMISTFGCVNGMSLAGARVYYAMAQDGLFFQAAAKVDPKTHVPVAALWVQCLWAAALTLSGHYGDLLDYVIFAVLLFYALTIIGIFVLRAKRPDLPRPYRAIGYPILPALYVLLAAGIEVLLLLYKPNYTWPGLIIVLLGVPVYYLWRRKEMKINEVQA
jgi:APA family basic amino acid/polyamine antiporter